MQAGEMIFISVDDHVIEPPHLFDSRLPRRYADLAPRVTRAEHGDNWVFAGQVIPNIAVHAVAGRPKEEYGYEPTTLDEVRPGCYDINERVKDMSAGGVLASICFPSFPGFSGRVFLNCEDKELALAVVRAYNDWHIDEWCGTYPGRFIPMAIPVLWDPLLCAEEVRRVAAKGCHALTFTENPAALGLPSFHTEHWDPLWRALVDEGTTLNIHLGSSGKMVDTSSDAPMMVRFTTQAINTCFAAADLVWSRVFRNFPDLRVGLSEGGIGWVPYFLDRLDAMYAKHHQWGAPDYGDLRPSEVFRRHILTCFINDPIGLSLRDKIGIDNIAWENDYPHSDSSWPHSPEEFAGQADTFGLSDEEVNKITHQNAMRWYHFDPFQHRLPQDATVSRLRAEVADHDVTIRSRKDVGNRRSAGVG
jgi:predicted TIM-barrel fold metal-dependent hydrolase